MKITIAVDDGETVEFACVDNWVSKWVAEGILQGKTYPYLPFTHDVRTVLDVGANCGAATVYFARHYPDATIHAFEPGSEQRYFLEENAATLPNVHVHPIGLHDDDRDAELFKGDGDTGMSSIIRRSVNLDESETIQLRHGGRWVEANGIELIDILKVDVEGAEIPVLESLADQLPGVQVLYLEYDSRQSRRRIEELVADTHWLYMAHMLTLDQGEAVYISRELADLDAASEHLTTLFRPS
jgi:FkbM family methyltransferase